MIIAQDGKSDVRTTGLGVFWIVSAGAIAALGGQTARNASFPVLGLPPQFIPEKTGTVWRFCHSTLIIETLQRHPEETNLLSAGPDVECGVE